MKNELLSKKESASDDLKISQPVQIACSENKAKGMAE